MGVQVLSLFSFHEIQPPDYFHLSGLGTPSIHFLVPQYKSVVCDYLWHIVIMLEFFHLLSGLQFNACILLKATSKL